jgi:hypothetical protein
LTTSTSLGAPPPLLLADVDGPLTFFSGSATDVAGKVFKAADGNGSPGNGKFCSRRFISLRCLKDRTPCMMGSPAEKKKYFHPFQRIHLLPCTLPVIKKKSASFLFIKLN